MFMDPNIALDVLSIPTTANNHHRNPNYSDWAHINSNGGAQSYRLTDGRSFSRSESSSSTYLLGTEYHMPEDYNEFVRDFQSQLWFTYRKNYKPIGGTGALKSDSGWGCCHRCGQMLMGHALIRHYLGREWRWTFSNSPTDRPTRQDPKYYLVLREFADTPQSRYSIHQIASQCVDFGRPLGTWAGPNTISQALRVLSMHDPSHINVHIAMDMLVVRSTIMNECKNISMYISQDETLTNQIQSTENGASTPDRSPHRHSTHIETQISQSMVVFGDYTQDSDTGAWREVTPYDVELASPYKYAITSIQNKIQNSKPWSKIANVFNKNNHNNNNNNHNHNNNNNRGNSNIDSGRINLSQSLPKNLNYSIISNGDFRRFSEVNGNDNFNLSEFKNYNDTSQNSSNSSVTMDTSVNSCVYVNKNDQTHKIPILKKVSYPSFRPLLLIIPLRLGQDKFNPVYAAPLLACLTIPYCIGIIGGRPKHALYIIGYYRDTLFYLDPHTTQQGVTEPYVKLPDESYHATQFESMHINELDPSLAVGFYCPNEATFLDLLDMLEKEILNKTPQLFDISENIPFILEKTRKTSFKTEPPKEPFSLIDKSDLVDSDIDDDWDIVDM